MITPAQDAAIREGFRLGDGSFEIRSYWAGLGARWSERYRARLAREAIQDEHGAYTTIPDACPSCGSEDAPWYCIDVDVTIHRGCYTEFHGAPSFAPIEAQDVRVSCDDCDAYLPLAESLFYELGRALDDN